MRVPHGRGGDHGEGAAEEVKTLLRVLLVLLAALLLAFACYAAYVLLTYYRLEDELPLEVEGTAEESGPAALGERYRVVSYNIGFGAYSDDYSFFMDGGTESRARSAEAVYENVGGGVAAAWDAAPDFLLLQEVDVYGTRSRHVDEYAYAASLLPELGQRIFAQNYDSPYLFWPILEPHGANLSGQVTFSRYAVSSALRRSLPIEEGLMKLVDLDRCYSVSRIPLENGRELVLYNFHLSAYTSDGTIAEEQLKMLFADMRAEYAAGNYAVAGGDFNKDILGDSAEIFGVSGEAYTWAQPIPPELVPEELTIVAPFDEETPVASCRNADRPYGSDSFLLTADGFIVSGNVMVVDFQVIDTGFRWSDHNPVYMDFILMA